MKKAIFKLNGGNPVLLCSECRTIIKTRSEFGPLEVFAMKGETILDAQYCSQHQYLTMFGMERKREMLRKGIQDKLREGIMRKNVLNIAITRPDQKLIIMRGIPGSGKSTKANKIVGEGVIHSTDALVEATGDYNGHFQKMIASNDWSAHGRMHKQCFLDAKESMIEGVSPVIVDNTNIKPKEARNYVEAALKLGLDENNIKVVDVGDGGCTAEVLTERNTHNVPLNVVRRMMQSHASVGELTVKKILNYKGSVQMTNESNYNDSEIGSYNTKPKKILYSAVVLDEKSKGILKNDLTKLFYDPKIHGEKWELFAHHMTIVFGKGLEDKSEVGKTVQLTATELGISDMAVAVKVEGYPSANAIPHITVAVNIADGGKPFMSNKITDWTPLNNPIVLSGIVTEIMP